MKLQHLLFYLFIFLSTSGFAPPSIDLNNEGVQDYKNEKYTDAFKNFVDALARDPYNPTLHFNLADNFHKAGENEKALTEFESIEKSAKADGELKYQAMFNAGNVAIETKNIDKALQYYQKALEYKPDSVETKTNIELALKDPNGGGGGKDNKDNQKDQKDQKDKPKDNKDQKDQEKKDQDKPAPRPTPKPFKSQALNESEVRRILEELKRQEQEIRAKQQKHKNTPESQIEKDW